LGIGAAGGSANKDEGKVLAGRLNQMRKARDDRAQQKKTQTKEVPVPVEAGLGMPSMDEMQTEMDSVTQATTSPKNSANKIKNKNKKKKKRKKGKR
jgi:hypothetical protein